MGELKVIREDAQKPSIWQEGKFPKFTFSNEPMGWMSANTTEVIVRQKINANTVFMMHLNTVIFKNANRTIVGEYVDLLLDNHHPP